MKFDITKVKTCLNAEDVKEGDRGFVGDSLAEIMFRVENNHGMKQIEKIGTYGYLFRFCVGDSFDYALFYPYEPQTETRVKDPLTVMKWIIDHDYEVDEDGDWWDGTENCMIFYANMWQYCGKRLVENQKWHADLLEEVEVC